LKDFAKIFILDWSFFLIRFLEALHLVVGVTKWHRWHETWHSHELLLSGSITCGSWHTRHLRIHHWDHWGHCSKSSCWVSCSIAASRCGTIGVHHLLLHSHLLSKHRLVLLEHLLMHSHLLVNHLLLVKHHLLRSVDLVAVLVGCRCHRHHTRHHSS